MAAQFITTPAINTSPWQTSLWPAGTMGVPPTVGVSEMAGVGWGQALIEGQDGMVAIILHLDQRAKRHLKAGDEGGELAQRFVLVRPHDRLQMRHLRNPLW